MPDKESPPHLSRRRRESQKKAEANVRQATELFSSLFFGWTPQLAPSSVPTKERPSTYQSPSATVRTKPVEKETKEPLSGAQAAFVAQLDKLLPRDPQELRATNLYQEAYKQLQWQRDNYLVGGEYANWRKLERLRMSDRVRSVKEFQQEIQFDESCLGHQQVARLAADFVPSPTVKQALLPLITPLPMTALYGPTQRALVNVILGQQDNLDQIVKAQLLQFLQNPKNRIAFKNQTSGYISTTYRDGKS